MAEPFSAAGEVEQTTEHLVLTRSSDMGKRGTNLDNISPLKARRRELRNNPTTAERVLWRHLQRRQLLGKKFRRQYSIGPFIVDFFCVECELGIELDGEPHYFELKEDYETARTAFLESLGVELIRFENRDVHTNVEAVLETIRLAITRRNL